jgi:uncharacterized membrane protein
LMLIILLSFAFADNYSLSKVSIIYEFNPDASINVTERLSFDFFGIFSSAFRSIKTIDGMSVDDFNVFLDAGEGRLEPIQYEYKETSGGINYYWVYSAQNETKTFVLKYKLTGAVNSYYDSYEFYRMLWDPNWDTVAESFSAQIIFPAPLSKGTKIWIHSDSNSDYVLEGNSVWVNAKNVPANTFIKIRILLGKEILSGERALMKNGSGEDAANNSEGIFIPIQKTVVFPVLLLQAVLAIIIILLAGAFFYYYKAYSEKKREYASLQARLCFKQKTSLKQISARMLNKLKMKPVRASAGQKRFYYSKKDD